MYGNGGGTGLHTVTMERQKVEAIQLVPHRGLTASAAAVVCAASLTAVLFLAVAPAPLTTATTASTAMVFVLCVKQTSVC